MLSFEQLTFNIDPKNFFTNISMTFLPSTILYLQGVNGVGNTSFYIMIAGIQNPIKGKVQYKSLECRNLTKPYYNYIGHNIGLKSRVTVIEYLKFWSTIYNSLEALDASIYYFNLYHILQEKYYRHSASNQKKITLVKLIACQTNLWLLDEIEANLDQGNKELLNNLIIPKANNGGIIILTSNSHPEIKTAQILHLLDYIMQS